MQNIFNSVCKQKTYNNIFTIFLFLVLYTQVKIYYVGDVVSECVHTGQAEMLA